MRKSSLLLYMGDGLFTVQEGCEALRGQERSTILSKVKAPVASEGGWEGGGTCPRGGETTAYWRLPSGHDTPLQMKW